jgi:hypothetical protein
MTIPGRYRDRYTLHPVYQSIPVRRSNYDHPRTIPGQAHAPCTPCVRVSQYAVVTMTIPGRYRDRHTLHPVCQSIPVRRSNYDNLSCISKHSIDFLFYVLLPQLYAIAISCFPIGKYVHLANPNPNKTKTMIKFANPL